MTYINYLVKTTYFEESECTHTLFHHRENALDFIIKSITECDEKYDDAMSENDIDNILGILNETNLFVDKATGFKYEIVPIKFKDSL